MTRFITKDDFWNLFPEAEIAVVIAKGINNGKVSEKSDEMIQAELDKANDEVYRFFNQAVFSDNEVISVWRDAYRKFKTKKGARCSIENLLKRVQKGNPVRRINPLVDIYNIISLKYGIPCGGEDIDKFEGDLVLTLAQGGEHFVPIGDEEPDNALPGELIYMDDAGAVCRCWNWKDGQRTMLTEDTKNAFLIIESVNPNRKDEIKEIALELAEDIKDYLGGNTEIHHLNIECKQIEF